MRHSSVGMLAIVSYTFAPVSLAVTPFVEVQASSDIGQTLSGVPVSDNTVFTEAGGGIAEYPLMGVPVTADIDGFAFDPQGSALLSLDIGAELPGPLTVRHNDVVAHDGSDWWVAFDAAAAGLPEGVDVDAVSLWGGQLVLSFDTQVAADGDTFADEDLVRYDGTALSMFLDTSSTGIAPSADLDAVHILPNGHVLASFDTSVSIDGETFDHADVLEYDPGNDSWELAYRATLLPGWQAADLNAFAATTDSDGDGVFDHLDNCLGAANTAQRDTDGDGFGNLCDADLNNDCVVNPVDLGILKSRYFSNDTHADFNGDGVVNVLDLGLLRVQFFLPPGPTAHNNPCQ